MNTATTLTNLLGLTRSELEAFVAGLGEKPFRARQLMKWMYRRGVGDVAAHRLVAEADGGSHPALAKAILHAVPVD